MNRDFGKKTKGCFSSKARFSAVIGAFCSSIANPNCPSCTRGLSSAACRVLLRRTRLRRFTTTCFDGGCDCPRNHTTNPGRRTDGPHHSPQLARQRARRPAGGRRGKRSPFPLTKPFRQTNQKLPLGHKQRRMMPLRHTAVTRKTRRAPEGVLRQRLQGVVSCN